MKHYHANHQNYLKFIPFQLITYNKEVQKTCKMSINTKQNIACLLQIALNVLQGFNQRSSLKMTFIMNISRDIFFSISHKANYLLPNKLNLDDSYILLMLSHAAWIERVLFYQALSLGVFKKAKCTIQAFTLLTDGRQKVYLLLKITLKR